MQNRPDFFSRLPLEVLEHLYSNLDDPKDFLAAWETLHGAKQRAVELVVFSKNESRFYPLQLILLNRLVKFRTQLLNNDSAYLNLLAKKFRAKLKNSQLSTHQRIQGLKQIAAVNNTSLHLGLSLKSTSGNP